MDRNAESDGEGIADQPTHSRLYRSYLCSQFGIRISFREELSHEAMVQIEDWATRLHADLACELMARGVRTIDVLNIQ